ncbi:hypothetical protein ACIBF5_25870 [Micromonospora sp. NPDC050417]|uniref:hypothetical protein n=1 Tax=Micromonospora sp. NPDC050417 TaxID=3364280 RepID=UPI0037A112A6
MATGEAIMNGERVPDGYSQQRAPVGGTPTDRLPHFVEAPPLTPHPAAAPR